MIANISARCTFDWVDGPQRLGVWDRNLSVPNCATAWPLNIASDVDGGRHSSWAQSVLLVVNWWL